MKIDARKIALTGFLAALVFLATTFIKVTFPAVHGMYNLGDAVIIVSAYILGGPLGAVAGAIGSLLADLFSGYANYAVATLIIKGLMGLVAGMIMSKGNAKKVRIVLSAIVAEIIMIIGYFGYEFILYRDGAFASIVFNSIQAVFGATVGIVLIFALRKFIEIRKNR